MNAADLATVLTVFGCGGVAGLVAASEKAGWFTVLFVAVGLVVGFGCAAGVHKLAYRLLDVAGRQTRAASGWAWLLAYTLLPLMAAFAAMALTGWLAFVIVRQVL
jgi:hypothetical protein